MVSYNYSNIYLTKKAYYIILWWDAHIQESSEENESKETVTAVLGITKERLDNVVGKSEYNSQDFDKLYL
jgi:hypothetical protein